MPRYVDGHFQHGLDGAVLVHDGRREYHHMDRPAVPGPNRLLSGMDLPIPKRPHHIAVLALGAAAFVGVVAIVVDPVAERVLESLVGLHDA